MGAKSKKGGRKSAGLKKYLVGQARGLGRADGPFVDVGGKEEGAVGRAQRLGKGAGQHGRGAAAAGAVWCGG